MIVGQSSIRVPTDHLAFAGRGLWALPFVVAVLVAIDLNSNILDAGWATAIAALAITLFGIPHGTLDVEIAAHRFGMSTLAGKTRIIAAYLAVAALTAMCWFAAPAAALTLFLLVSMVHFGEDWLNEGEPFLAMMVGWGLISVHALAHPQAVSDIFVLLTNDASGATIADLLAIASAPAILGCIVYILWAFRTGATQLAVEVLSCLAAALLLPPLVAFAIFFCGLHSPRHMASAIAEAGGISQRQKALVIVAVTALSLGFGALLFTQQGSFKVEDSIIRTAFILISILTVPHFILEQLMRRPLRVAASA